MSRGLSWQQRHILVYLEVDYKDYKKHRDHPVLINAMPLRMLIDYALPSPEDPDAFYKWDSLEGIAIREQTMRRTLRSLERRGLVTLQRYSCRPDAEHEVLEWSPQKGYSHRPGVDRYMVCATLTDEGLRIAEAIPRRISVDPSEMTFEEFKAYGEMMTQQGGDK